MTRRLVLAALLAALGSGCPDRSRAAVAREDGEGVRCPVARVTSRDVVHELVLPVELHSWQRVAIVARVSGYVRDVRVDRGSEVKAGDLLATVAAPELEDEQRRRAADVRVVEAELASCVADHDLKAVTAKRVESLTAEMAASVQEFDVARAKEVAAAAAIDQARAKLAATREALRSTETWLSYTSIAAPFTGVVTERWIHPGAFVSAAERSPLFELVDRSTLRGVIDVPAPESPLIVSGATRVQLRFPELAAPLELVVNRSAASLDAKTRTLKVEVDIPNRDHRLLPRMFGQATLRLEVHPGVHAVPAKAIFQRDGAPHVFLVRDGRACLVKLQTGLAEERVVEVVSGIEEGALVALQPHGLKEGVRVAAIEDAR